MKWSELMECQLYGGSGEDTNNTKKIRVLSTDSHKRINFMIRRELNIAETEAETRLWVKSIHNGAILSLGNLGFQVCQCLAGSLVIILFTKKYLFLPFFGKLFLTIGLLAGLVKIGYSLIYLFIKCISYLLVVWQSSS